MGDPSLIVHYEGVRVTNSLSYEEVPVEYWIGKFIDSEPGI